MEENKHFSHGHSLDHHRLPDGAEITCSGCNSTATGTVYVCWQCSFYLHENCYRATRSLKHPSHPSHPLTLVPYPTYPSNSFYCNLCKLVGTGFSYSCSSCEFDIHVQCAYTEFSNQTPNFNPYQSIPNQFSTLDSSPNAIVQETTQRAYMPHHIIPHHLMHNISRYNYTIPIQTPSFNPQTDNIHYPIPTNPIADHSQKQENPSFNPQTDNSHYPIPTNPIADHSQKQENPSFNSPTNVYTANAPANTQSSYSSETRDGSREIMHFSHNHGLTPRNVTEQDFTNCSACEKPISGLGFSCNQSSCNFHLHDSCFHLAEKIQHLSHPNHPLTLLSIPPYEYKEFICSACSNSGRGFTYHCSVCEYDLHVNCASLPEKVKREDHQHVLQLQYLSPTKGTEFIFVCDVCHENVNNDCWTYYCKECDFGTHLDCVNSEVGEFVDLETQLAALQIELKIRKKGRENALALLDPPGTTYKWTYADNI